MPKLVSSSFAINFFKLEIPEPNSTDWPQGYTIRWMQVVRSCPIKAKVPGRHTAVWQAFQMLLPGNQASPLFISHMYLELNQPSNHE